MTVKSLSRARDELEIGALLLRWGYARNAGDWDALARCFHEGATIQVSWFLGPAADFIARLRSAPTRPAGGRAKYVCGSPLVRVQGRRAFSECDADLYIRTTVSGQDVDLHGWLRFLDLLEKRKNRWGIVRRSEVYEKDRLDPVDPGVTLQDVIGNADLTACPPAARYLCYVMSGGRGERREWNITSGGSADEAALRRECEAWLAGG